MVRLIGNGAAMLVAAILAVVVVEQLPRTLEPVKAVAEVRFPEVRFPLTEERVIDLPEDGNTWHTILFLRPDWKSNAAERKARTIWFTDPGLISLREQTHWHVITTDSAEFKPFSAIVPATPCLLVERANGEAIYRETGPQIGRDSEGLRRAIRREVQRHCPDGKCLPIHPTPGPDEFPPREEIPEFVKPEEPKAPERGLGAAIAVIIAGAVGGKLLGFKRGF